MRFRFSNLVFLFVFTFFCQNLLAITGYKNVEFGTPLEEALKGFALSFQKTPTNQAGVEFYSCENFKFGNSFVEAGAFFINKKFLRFVVVVPVDQVAGIVKGLVKKYGPVSSQSPQSTFTAVDSYPNSEAYIAFDSDTVFLKIMSDAFRKQTALLLYTSPEYDRLILQMQQNAFEDDL